MSDTYTVSDQIPTTEDWQDSEWVLDAGRADLVPRQTMVSIDSDLNITLYYPRGAIYSSQDPATISAGGLLSSTFSAVNDGAPMIAVFTMIILEDSEDPNVQDRHITMLTMVDDPDDVGVMAGSGGG